jgi:hypothetical protein
LKDHVEGLLEDAKKELEGRGIELNYQVEDNGEQEGGKRKEQEQKPSNSLDEKQQEDEKDSFEDLLKERMGV